MIDLEKAEKVFDEYVSNYDDNDAKTVLKKHHTKRVQKEAKEIAEYLKLAEEDRKLAELIGLLHDIGRFEQLKRYHTFSDRNSVDHAELGLEILFQDGYIRKFVEDEQYDDIIYKAIHNHNKYKIEEGLTERELLHSKIIRDADKLDILMLIRTEPLETLFNKKEITNEEISKEVYEQTLNCKTIERSFVKTDLDRWLVDIAFIFDMYFPISLKKVKENGYIHDLIARIDYKEETTREKMKKIEQVAYEYMQKRIEEG